MKAIGTMTVLNLPPEMIESILSQISRPHDLLQLACTCSSFRELIIPRHLEYRVLKLPNPTSGKFDYIWHHLAQRPNLTRNMYKVHIVSRDIGYRGWDAIYPKRLVDPNLDRTPLDAPEKRDGVTISALRLMVNLQGLAWHWKNPPPSTKLLGFLLNRLSAFPTMTRLTLIANTPRTSSPSLEKLVISSNRASPIQQLRLGGKFWGTLAHPDMGSIIDWLQTLTSVKALTLSSSLIPRFDKLSFPWLQKLKLPSCDSRPAILNFLARHKKITTLDWSSRGDMTVPRNILPNLTTVRCNIEIIRAMNDADTQDGTSPLPRPIERLVLLDSFIPNDTFPLCNFTCLDHSKLRYLGVSLSTIGQLQHIAQSFPMIRELQLGGLITDFDMEELYSTLQLLPHLEVLQSYMIWLTIPLENFHIELESRIWSLATLLPALRQVNYPNGVKQQILIIRGESVTYRVVDREYTIFKEI